MFGGMFFGQGFFGGDSSDSTAVTPTGTGSLAADAASVTDWDTATAGLGSDEAARGAESALTSGLGAVNADEPVTDTAQGTESVRTTGLGSVTPPPPPPVVVVVEAGDTVVRFVDSVSVTAGLRMSLSNTYWTVLHKGTETPPPPMRDQRSDSMLCDGSLITGSVYENRTITLALQLKAPTAAIAATEIQSLQRELDRETNVLYWQPNTLLPAQWIRTYRGPDVTQDIDWGINLHHFTVTIEAEPLAIGAPVTRTVTMYNDPNASTNPCWVEFQDVLGDVATPLYLKSADTILGGRKVAVGTRRRGSPSSVTWFRQAENPGMTLGADAVVNTANASGASSSSMVRVSFASTPANAVRLSGLFPAASGGTTDWRGAYRVFMRARLNNGVIKVQVATGTTVASRNQQVTLAETSSWMWYDLGVVNLPVGNVGRQAGYGAEFPGGPSTLRFYAEQASSGSFDIDNIFLMPADETYALAQLPTMNVGASVVMDGVNGDVYPVTAAGELAESTGSFIPYADGQLPTVSPGAVNRLFILAGVTGANLQETTFGSFYSLDVTYWPLYRVIRPVAT